MQKMVDFSRKVYIKSISGSHVNRRAIMTHIGGESASKIDPPEQTL